jgi:hypothetical protein
MQLYGGQGLTQHTPLPEMWTYARFVRIADGPDSSHRHQVGRDQLKTAEGFRDKHMGIYTEQENWPRYGASKIKTNANGSIFLVLMSRIPLSSSTARNYRRIPCNAEALRAWAGCMT